MTGPRRPPLTTWRHSDRLVPRTIVQPVSRLLEIKRQLLLGMVAAPSRRGRSRTGSVRDRDHDGGVPSEPTVLDIHPLTPARWPDVEDLFGPNGAIAGCWCMYWRKAGRDPYGPDNRSAFHDRVEADPPPGLLAYAGDRAVGWAQVGRREEFVRIERSRHLGPLDDVPVWSLNCFYIRRGYRKRGVARALLDGAIAFAAEHGATTLEAYPVDRPAPSAGDLYTGVPSMFADAGFTEVARRHPSRPVMRRRLS